VTLVFADPFLWYVQTLTNADSAAVDASSSTSFRKTEKEKEGEKKGEEQVVVEVLIASAILKLTGILTRKRLQEKLK
jgi:hypothetical protein